MYNNFTSNKLIHISSCHLITFYYIHNLFRTNFCIYKKNKKEKKGKKNCNTRTTRFNRIEHQNDKKKREDLQSGLCWRGEAHVRSAPTIAKQDLGFVYRVHKCNVNISLIGVFIYHICMHDERTRSILL